MVKRRNFFLFVITLNTGKYSFKNVEHGKYLRTRITKHNEIVRGVAIRIHTSNNSTL